MEYPILLVFSLLHVLQSEGALTEDWKLISSPSFFLEPPPMSRNIKTHRPIKSHSTNQNANSRSAIQKWFQPAKTMSTKLWAPFADPLTKSVDYGYRDLQCNPCNSVPWIPIIRFSQPKAIPQSQIQHQSIPTVSTFGSYYQTINQMTGNLIKPINVLTPNTIPFYIGPPVYQQQVQNPVWHAGPSLIDTSGMNQGQNLNFDGSFLSTPNAQLNNHQDSVQVQGVPNWIQETKPIPLFHYTHAIEYPPQFVQAQSNDLLPQPTPVAQPEIAYSNSANFNDPGNDILHDISNHLDDIKYSSSENKFSIASNDSVVNSVKDGKQLRSNDTEETISTTELMDYLTPPSVSSNEGWSQAHSEPEVEIKPLDDWAFVKEAETKPEKRKKQIQIVIPYTVNKQSKYNAKQLKENFTNWDSILKVNDARSSSTTTMLPIIRYLRDNATTKKQEWTDWHKLRKAIDSWTVERFSNHRYNTSAHLDVTSTTMFPSIDMPKDYLYSTVSYRDSNDVREKPDEIENRVSSVSKKSQMVSSDRESKLWKTLPAAFTSPTTKEKVYIVTPVPLTSYNFSSNDIGLGKWGL